MWSVPSMLYVITEGVPYNEFLQHLTTQNAI